MSNGEAVEAPANEWPTPIVELRQYRLHSGKRDDLIGLFEREFIETQEAVGMRIIGQFRDSDDPDRFVWLRGFKDMAAREQGLNAFYFGPVWQAHRNAANAAMQDSDNVLLLREARPGSGFALTDRVRAPVGSTTLPGGLVVATIYYLKDEPDRAFVDLFEASVRPKLESVGIPVLATFVSERSPNNFPQLPIREGENVFVWFSRFKDQADYAARLELLEGSPGWHQEPMLDSRLSRAPEVLKLEPAARSALRD